MSFLKTSDPAVYNAIMQETTRLKETIDLIASENYTSKPRIWKVKPVT
jgi:glycine hydroxymethyltransferase